MPAGLYPLLPIALAAIGIQLYNWWLRRIIEQEYRELLYVATKARYPEQS